MKYLVTCVAILTASTIAHARGPNTTILQRSDLYVESVVRMLTVLEAATGNVKKAACIHNQYFGSPLATRETVNTVWQDPNYQAHDLTVVTLHFLGSCNGSKVDSGRFDQMWEHTNTGDIHLDKSIDGRVELHAAIQAVILHGIVTKKKQALECVRRAHMNGTIRLAFHEKASLPDDGSRISVIYDAVRETCGYPETGRPSSELVLPLITDLLGAARERLLAVRDLQLCDTQGSASRPDCVIKLFGTRQRALSEATLRAADNKVKASKKNLEDTVERVGVGPWQLPDGRPIFKDNRGVWHFKDGTAVPPELAKTRIMFLR